MNNLKSIIDTDGYLINFKIWNTTIAKEIAKIENITLNNKHWEIINYIREFYSQYNISPTVRMLLEFIAQKNKIKKNSIYLFNLFPQGPAKQATKIAGLPKSIVCL